MLDATEALTSVPRLKRLWRHPTHRSPKEVHHDWWPFLDERQLRRAVASAGDPLRLRCLVEKLEAGRAVKLGIVGGSVSFGTTFTTSRSRALYHWNRSFLEEARGDVDAAIAEARAFEDKGGAPADAAARLEELGA